MGACEGCGKEGTWADGHCGPCAARLLADETYVGEEPPPGGAEDETSLFSRAKTLVAGRYELIRVLGSGGMGGVHLALDHLLGVEVALKMPRREMLEDPVLRDLLRREVLAARRVTHACVCRVHDLVEWEGGLYLTMEAVEGETLKDLLARKGRLEPAEAIPLLRQIAEGLRAVHAAGVVHRDLKPANVLLATDGRVRLSDFGISCFSSSGESDGLVAGTPDYMAPEQAAGDAVDARADVFSYGVLAYETLAGFLPFPPRSPRSGGGGAPLGSAPLQTVIPGLDPVWKELVLRCLERDPARRFRDAGSLLEEWPGAVLPRPKPRPAGAPQRRLVTVLRVFILPSSVSALDPEDAADALKALEDRAEVAIRAHGGEMLQRTPEGVIAVWGAGASREDDAEMAVRAALETLAARAITSGPALDASAAVHTGQALVTPGPGGEATVAGEAVSGASSVAASAGSPGVFVSREAHSMVRGLFEVRGVSARGGSGTEVFRVLRALPRSFLDPKRGIEGISVPMIGRSGELARLRQKVEEAFQDSRTVLTTVVGEAGVGKSRLVREFVDRLDGFPEPPRVFRARAHPSMTSTPYGLLRDLFASAFGILDSDPSPEAAAKLERGVAGLTPGDGRALERAHFLGFIAGFGFRESASLKNILEDPAQIRARAFACLGELLGVVTGRGDRPPLPGIMPRHRPREGGRPVLVLLEDLHWADEPSLDAVAHLTAFRPDLPLAFLCATRSSLFDRRASWGEGEEAFDRMDLAPLGRGEMRKLVEAILSGVSGFPQDLKVKVVEQAAGNPFYAEELLKMFMDDGTLVAAPGGWAVAPGKTATLRLPPTLTAVLQTRLDALPEDDRGVLQCASVVGPVFWDSALEALPGEGDPHMQAALALPELRRKEMILRREASAFSGAQEFAFKHSLLRDAAYESVLLKRRKAWHGKVARWLEGEARAAGRMDQYGPFLAEHYERAGEGERALEHLVPAIRQSLDQGAYKEAAGLGERALALLEGLPPAVGGTPEEGRRREARCEILLRTGISEGFLGNYTAAISHLKGSLEEDPSGGGRASVAETYHFLGSCQIALEEAEGWTHLAQAVETARQSGDELLQMRCLMGAIFRRAERGYYKEAREDCLRAIRLGRHSRALGVRARMKLSLGSYYYQDGRGLRRARAYLEDAVAWFSRTDDLRGVLSALSTLTSVCQEIGDLDSAKRHGLEAISIAERMGSKDELSVLFAAVGNIYNKNKKTLEYCRWSLKAYCVAQKTGRWVIILASLSNLANSLLGMGRSPDAAALASWGLEKALSFKMHRHAVYLLWTLAEANQAQGRTVEAVEWMGAISASPALPQNLRSELDDLLVKWSSGVPPEAYESALARGRDKSLEVMAREVLESVPPPPGDPPIPQDILDAIQEEDLTT